MLGRFFRLRSDLQVGELFVQPVVGKGVLELLVSPEGGHGQGKVSQGTIDFVAKKHCLLERRSGYYAAHVGAQ
jgi:hypothetical protein